MQFSVSAAAVLAFVASAFAQTADFDPIYTPESGEVVPAGSTFKITWSAPPKYAGETISIHLIGGETQDTQVPLADIAAGVSNDAESYDWAVDSALGDKKFYGLVFKLESNPDVFQYSNPFKIDGPADDGEDTTTTYTATGGVKTISLSSTAVVETTVPVVTPTATVYPDTTVIVDDETTTVPCNKTAIPVTKHTTITDYNCNGNCTIKTSIVPPAQTNPPVVPTSPAEPTTTPVTGAAARVGAGSLAVAGALAMAFFAL